MEVNLFRILSQEMQVVCEQSSLFGESIGDIEEQQKELSNKLALESGEEGSKRGTHIISMPSHRQYRQYIDSIQCHFTERIVFYLSDIGRTGFVVAAATAAAALLQANWVHDHEVFSMTAVFLLGYVGTQLTQQA